MVQKVLLLIQRILDRVMESIQSILQLAETSHENHPEDRVNNFSRHSEFSLSAFL
jgi:hypothetical protein